MNISKTSAKNTLVSATSVKKTEEGPTKVLTKWTAKADYWKRINAKTDALVPMDDSVLAIRKANLLPKQKNAWADKATVKFLAPTAKATTFGMESATFDKLTEILGTINGTSLGTKKDPIDTSAIRPLSIFRKETSVVGKFDLIFIVPAEFKEWGEVNASHPVLKIIALVIAIFPKMKITETSSKCRALNKMDKDSPLFFKGYLDQLTSEEPITHWNLLGRSDKMSPEARGRLVARYDVFKALYGSGAQYSQFEHKPANTFEIVATPKSRNKKETTNKQVEYWDTFLTSICNIQGGGVEDYVKSFINTVRPILVNKYILDMQNADAKVPILDLVNFERLIHHHRPKEIREKSSTKVLSKKEKARGDSAVIITKERVTKNTRKPTGNNLFKAIPAERPLVGALLNGPSQALTTFREKYEKEGGVLPYKLDIVTKEFKELVTDWNVMDQTARRLYVARRKDFARMATDLDSTKPKEEKDAKWLPNYETFDEWMKVGKTLVLNREQWEKRLRKFCPSFTYDGGIGLCTTTVVPTVNCHFTVSELMGGQSAVLPGYVEISDCTVVLDYCTAFYNKWRPTQFLDGGANAKDFDFDEFCRGLTGGASHSYITLV